MRLEGSQTGAQLRTTVCPEGLTYYEAALATGSAQGEAPSCLEVLGLLTPAADDQGTLVPVPPDVAAAALAHPVERAMMEQQQALNAMRTVMLQVEDVYRRIRQEMSTSVQRLSGPSVISAALEHAVQSCEREVLTAQPGGGHPAEMLAEALPRALEASDRGIAQRTLYQHTVRAHGPTLDYVKRVTEAGVEVRTVDEVFDRLIVYDRSLAFIPDSQGARHMSAVMIRDSGVVHYLASIFEHVWERAEPVTYRTEHQRPQLLTEATRLNVLRLMVDGYTDSAIASRLGMSTRTIATHIKKASDLLGSNSRAQLAYLIAQAGLLDPPSPDHPAVPPPPPGRARGDASPGAVRSC
ncbi:LuxR C-terminal-related transcriptional regulator [Streptomyces sp. 549]|uniref:helix-turn-helix transcriptional regulator n=1 Tax=Streptomyces sp. 549 TaxID=3049076 RepID=UPI0024C28424|nr:LuxR C-terminal-related transcriptional regulator [Streptomyces sp. 549]MDK1476527.1 LuxR C-terminal-related transcriptional regulator [Streptomyces sp. 549]